MKNVLSEQLRVYFKLVGDELWSPPKNLKEEKSERRRLK